MLDSWDQAEVGYLMGILKMHIPKLLNVKIAQIFYNLTGLTFKRKMFFDGYPNYTFNYATFALCVFTVTMYVCIMIATLTNWCFQHHEIVLFNLSCSLMLIEPSQLFYVQEKSFPLLIFFCL